MNATAVDFEQLYREPDPFGYRSRWYEQRKRALLLACLPQARYARAWELGCSNGELSAALALRCDRLLATDISTQAVAEAARRLGASPWARAQRADHPRDWPQGRYDLIVFSEVGYYLDAPDFARTAAALAATLAPGGCLVACHWRHGFDAARRSAAEVHAGLDQALGLPVACRYEDADFLLQAWHDGPSVAQREGLR